MGRESGDRHGLQRPLSRRQALAGLGAGAAVAGGLAGSIPVAEAAEKHVDKAAGEVGVAPVGTAASRFVGEIDQNGNSFVAYGFFIQIAGLSQAALFSTVEDPLAESTAHFTFHGTASLVQRAVVDNRVFVLDVAGSLGYYYQQSPSAGFNDPASFARGLLVAHSEFKLQTVLSTISPNDGLETIEGPLTQLSAKSFRHQGRSIRFGHKDLKTQMIASGGGTRTKPLPPVVELWIGGSQIVTS